MSTTAFPAPTGVPLTGAATAPGRGSDTHPGADAEAPAGAAAVDGEGAGLLATAGDRSFDFSLRVLTVLVLLGLVGSVGLLGYIWIEPKIARPADAPAAATEFAPKPATPAPKTEPPPPKEVMRDPRKPFKCMDGNRIIVQDEACVSPARPLVENPAAER